MKARPESVEQLIWELRRAFRDLADAAGRELETLGIHAADRALLEFLAKETEPVSLAHLARKYAVSRQHIHQTLRRLPHPEWVEEIQDPTDRRTIRLKLSRKGRASWEKIRAVDQTLLNRLAGRLAQEPVVAATGLLKQLRHEIAHERN